MLTIKYSFTNIPTFPKDAEIRNHVPVEPLSGLRGLSVLFPLENIQEYYLEFSIRKKEHTSALCTIPGISIKNTATTRLQQTQLTANCARAERGIRSFCFHNWGAAVAHSSCSNGTNLYFLPAIGTATKRKGKYRADSLLGVLYFSGTGTHCISIHHYLNHPFLCSFFCKQ